MLQSRSHRYMDAVARLGSIRKAAEHLNLAPSAVNRQIIELERSFGVALFDRVPSGVKLTSAGETVLAYIRQANRDHDMMAARLRDLQGLKGGRVRLVAAPGLATTFIPRLAAPFCLAHPYIDLTVDVLPVDGIVNAVGDGDADLGLGFDVPRDARLRTMATINQPVGLVLRPDHPLAARPQVRLSDCVDLPFILPNPGVNMRMMLDYAFTEARIEPRVVVSSNSVDLRKQMVLGGAGVTVLTRSDVIGEHAAGILAHVPIRDNNLPGQSLKLICRAAGSLEPLQHAFAEQLTHALSGAT